MLEFDQLNIQPVTMTNPPTIANDNDVVLRHIDEIVKELKKTYDAFQEYYEKIPPPTWMLTSSSKS